MNNLKLFDFISMDINLMIDGQRRFQTFLGGIITIIVSILSIVTITFFGMEIILKDNPKVTTSNQYLKDGGYINLTNFPIMLNVVGRGGLVTPNFDTYYNISIVEYRFLFNEKNQSDLKITYFKTELCNEKSFPNTELANLFLKSIYAKNFTEHFCLGKLHKPLEIYGNIGSTNFSYVGIMIQKCVNGSNVVCKSHEEINKFFSKSLFVDMRLIDYSFEPEDYQNVGKIYPKLISVPLSAGIYKRIYVNYKMTDYFTDRGSIFKSLDHEVFYKYLNFEQNLSFNPSEVAFNKQTVNEITITVNTIKDINYRSYYKLQNLAADVGGIIKILMIFFNIINNYLSSKIFIHSLYNDIFYNIDENENKIEKEKENNIKDDIINNNKKVNNFINLKNIQKQTKIIKKFKILDVLCSFRKDYRTKLIIKRNESLIKKKLDLKYFIENMNVIEVIRYILFSKTENEIINYAKMNPIKIKYLDFNESNYDLINDINKFESVLNNVNKNDETINEIKKTQITRFRELLGMNEII